MESILQSVAADKNLRGGLARRAMLVCFAVVGDEEEQLDGYRRRLATLLY
jgi:thioredoxin-like negative regulator of GroEL